MTRLPSSESEPGTGVGEQGASGSYHQYDDSINDAASVEFPSSSSARV